MVQLVFIATIRQINISLKGSDFPNILFVKGRKQNWKNHGNYFFVPQSSRLPVSKLFRLFDSLMNPNLVYKIFTLVNGTITVEA